VIPISYELPRLPQQIPIFHLAVPAFRASGDLGVDRREPAWCTSSGVSKELSRTDHKRASSY
jgi:hypothetical protein